MFNRRNFLLTALGGLALAVPLQTTSANQAATRVRFQKGRTTAIVSGAIKASEEKTYLLGARAGQKILVHLSAPGKNMVFALETPSGEPINFNVTDTEAELETSGDYRIIVRSRGGSGAYTLEITIR